MSVLRRRDSTDRAFVFLLWLNAGLIAWCVLFMVWDAAHGLWFWTGFQTLVLAISLYNVRRTRESLRMKRRFEAWQQMRDKARWN